MLFGPYSEPLPATLEMLLYERLLAWLCNREYNVVKAQLKRSQGEIRDGGFMFWKGQKLTYIRTREGYGNVLIPDPSLHGELDDLVDQYTQVREERYEVKRFATVAINFALNDYDCIKEIFGNTIMELVGEPVNEKQFNPAQRPDRDKTDEFIRENQQYLDKIHQRIFTNSLMQNVYSDLQD
jgi:hypothetical protein